MPGTGHRDTFVIDNLPPAQSLPEVKNLDRLGYPEMLNATVELVDRHVAEGRGERIAIRAPGGLSWTYADLAARIDAYAHVLTNELGFVSGNRVLLRSANNPVKVALYLAIIKAGGVVVATMPLLRAKELAPIVEKAQTTLAFCDAALSDELEATRSLAPHLSRIVTWEGTAGGELAALARAVSGPFTPCATRADDPCLLGFTSGTTGVPKATIHTHRDLLVVCDCYSREVLRPTPEDVFIGSPPLAFTFGLGGLVLFPFRVGAQTVLVEKAAPPDLARAIDEYGATICFTAPTAYRAILSRREDYDLSSLRRCVSAGEVLPLPTFKAWEAATGLRLLDGIGSTEMLHIFIAAPPEAIRPGATGRPVPGYEAAILDENGAPAPDNVVGRLVVKGPIGCRYLADERQATYVQNGWNVTGDAYLRDEDGYYWFQARADDMIVSAGYNIAGPEVEASLLAHPAVAECGVVGAPCQERGTSVKAYVVLAPGHAAGPDLVKTLQDHVKRDLAPYKYPRAIEFVSGLPKTESGKLQRFALRQRAAAESASTT